MDGENDFDDDDDENEEEEMIKTHIFSSVLLFAYKRRENWK